MPIPSAGVTPDQIEGLAPDYADIKGAESSQAYSYSNPNDPAQAQQIKDAQAAGWTPTQNVDGSVTITPPTQ